MNDVERCVSEWADRLAAAHVRIKELETQLAFYAEDPAKGTAHVCHSCDGTGWTYG